MHCCKGHEEHKQDAQPSTAEEQGELRRLSSKLRDNLIWVCLAGVVAVFLAVRAFKLSIGSVLPWGVFLLCPLMHVFMMKDHGSHDHENHKEEKK